MGLTPITKIGQPHALPVSAQLCMIIVNTHIPGARDELGETSLSSTPYRFETELHTIETLSYLEIA